MKKLFILGVCAILTFYEFGFNPIQNIDYTIGMTPKITNLDAFSSPSTTAFLQFEYYKGQNDFKYAKK